MLEEEKKGIKGGSFFPDARDIKEGEKEVGPHP